MESAVLEGTLKNFDSRMIAYRKEFSGYSHYYSQLVDFSDIIQENARAFLTAEEQDMFRLFSERAGRLREETNLLREYCMQIREVYQAQLGIRQNEIMKTLTVVTVIFMPLTLIAGWYGMNFAGMPELRSSWGYPAVIAASALIVLVCIWFFKKKKFW